MAKDDMEIVSRVRKTLGDKVGNERFDLWFSDQVSFEYSNGTLWVRAPDSFTLDRLRTKLRAEIGTIPTVIVGKTLALPTVDCVLNDEYVGARLAVDHLHALGHRRIAHVSGGSGAGAAGRKSAYIAAMSGLGLKQHIDVIPGDFTESAGHAAIRTLLRRKQLPTAILAANDLVAVGLISELRAAGVSVPADISIVGYDNSMLSGLSLVSLTTIQQPLEELGAQATRLLLERLAGRTTHENIELAPTLIVRDSTARPRQIGRAHV